MLYMPTHSSIFDSDKFPIFVSISTDEPDSNPQTLLFSATVPPWVLQTGKKYMKENLKRINLVGNERNKTSKNVQVRMGEGLCLVL